MNNFDQTKDTVLLDKLLADDDWQVWQRQLHQHALHSFSATRRRRRLLRISGATTALFLIIGFWSFRVRLLPREPVIAQVIETKKTSPPLQTITEAQMLAMFPKGSCLVAEVNGHKELIFLDDRTAREGFLLDSPATPPAAN